MVGRNGGGTELSWRDRARRLGAIVADARLSADHPLVKVAPLSAPVFARLEGAVIAYLWHSLSQAYPDRAFALSGALMREEDAAILALPNRTPNGVLLPRRETFLAFNLIHQALADALHELGVLPRFAAVQLPCNVRIVSGAPDRETEQRPYASSKIHTDVWNGEPVSSILFNIPVLGDPHAVDLRFFEPRHFPEHLRGPLSDYALGNPVAESGLEYPVAFEMGHVCISDALSLHQTVKRRSALRLSLDFRAIARDLLPGETHECTASRAVYVTPEVWRAAGSTTILGSGEPLDAFQRRQRGEAISPRALSIANVDTP